MANDLKSRVVKLISAKLNLQVDAKKNDGNVVRYTDFTTVSNSFSSVTLHQLVDHHIILRLN